MQTRVRSQMTGVATVLATVPHAAALIARQRGAFYRVVSPLYLARILSRRASFPPTGQTYAAGTASHPLARAASELRLKIGDNVVALLKPSQVVIPRNYI